MGNKTKHILGEDFATFLNDIIAQAKIDIDSVHIVAPRMKVAA